MAKGLTRVQRAKIREEKIAADLAKLISLPLATGAPATPAALKGLLRAWRKLGTLTLLSAKTRLDLRERFVLGIEQIIGPLFKPQDFGAPDANALAERLVTMLERTGYATVPPSELRLRRGELAGELLEQLVLNLEELQKDLVYMARGQRALLNTKLGELVDANGELVPTLKGKFGQVRRATDLVIIDESVTPKTGKREKPKLPPRKFIDLARVSFFEHDGGSLDLLVSFLVETEVRMPSAARRAGKQIGVAQVRFAFGPDDWLHMTVDGRGYKVRPNQIVFAPTAINRTLVTVREIPQYRPSFTARGGYPEVFWRIGVSMRAKEIWRLVEMILR